MARLGERAHRADGGVDGVGSVGSFEAKAKALLVVLLKLQNKEDQTQPQARLVISQLGMAAPSHGPLFRGLSTGALVDLARCFA